MTTTKRARLTIGAGGVTATSAALLAVPLCLIAAACDTESAVESDELLAETSDAIQGGVDDTEFNASYPASVMLEVANLDGPVGDSGGTRCSGTLVTPRWVLTAGHCMEGDAPDGTPLRLSTWRVRVGPMGNQGGTDIPLRARTFLHTAATSGPIPKHDPRTGPIEFRDTDIALVRLDAPVPHPIGLHARLPQCGECIGNRTSFFGTLVGFSPEGYEQPERVLDPSTEPYLFCPGHTDGWRRRSSPSVLRWDWHSEGVAAVYTHLFTAPPHPDACDGLVGIGTGGDSGGSLYRSGTPRLLCGVISGDGPRHTTGGAINGLTADYHTSALDNEANLKWLRQGIRTSGFFPPHLAKNHGGILDDDCTLEDTIPVCSLEDGQTCPLEDTWEPRGDCPDHFTLDVPDGCDDRDHDGVADLWDNCPDIYNPEQLTTHDDDELHVNGDPLGDGLGAACDACPGVIGGAIDHLSNRNQEIEQLLAENQQLVEPIHPDQFASMADFETAKAAWLRAYRPDACDPMPIPHQDLRDGGDLPITFPPAPATCVVQGGCHPEIRNVIHIDRTPGDVEPGTDATLGLRFCDGRNVSGTTSTAAGRQQFKMACPYVPGAYRTPTTSPWKKIWTPAGDSWTSPPPTDDREWIEPPTGSVDVFWDFTKQGSAVITTPSGQFVKGILWATFRELTPPDPDMPNTDVEAFAATLGTGDASWGWKASSGPPEFNPIRDWVFCPTCPMRFQNPLLTRGNPEDWRVTVEGASMPFDAPDEATWAHHDEVLRGELVHVGMSEPFSALVRAFREDATVVRSVGIRDGEVASLLAAEGLDGMPAAQRKVPTFAAAATADEAGPGAAGGRGWALSVTRQRLYALGGVDSDGHALNEGFKLDLRTGAWRHYEFPASEGVGAVLAAVYRYEDQAIYFLDREGPRVRLRRWNAQRRLLTGVVQTLAVFDPPWGEFGSHALVAGDQGDLVLAGWNGPGRRKVRYARLHVDKAGHVSLASVFLHGDAITGPPLLADGGLYVTLAPTSKRPSSPKAPSGARILFTSFSSPGPADAPSLHPH